MVDIKFKLGIKDEAELSPESKKWLDDAAKEIDKRLKRITPKEWEEINRRYINSIRQT